MKEEENIGGQSNAGENVQPGSAGQVPDFNNSQNEKPKKGNSIAWIAGANFLALTTYTAFSAYNGGGAFSDAFFIFFHVSVCIIIALYQRSWTWGLTGLAVLLIGFSTCVNFLPGV